MPLPWHSGHQVDEAGATPTPPRKRRVPRRLAALGIAGLLLAVPVTVYANHLFSDVPTSNTFHAVISTLYGSRITGGCGGGKYCPNAAVTRGQMAAFLVRGLGRMGTTTDFGDDDWAPFTQPAAGPGSPHPFGGVAPLTFKHGGGVGGTAYVTATANVNLWTDEAGVCPCEVQAYIFNDDTLETSPTEFSLIGSEFAPIDPDIALIPGLPSVAYAETSMSLSYTFSVESGATNHYGIAIKVIPTNPPTTDPAEDFNSGWQATLQTIYVPFNENGQNPPGPSSTQGGKPTPRNQRNIH